MPPGRSVWANLACVEEADEKPTVTVRLSGPTAFQWPRADLDELRDKLASDNYELHIEQPRPPDKIHASLTAVGIFLAAAGTTKLLDSALKDAYDGAKRWLRNRFDKDENASAVVFTIYGPDGKPLKTCSAEALT
jgi:hypothetical protein